MVASTTQITPIGLELRPLKWFLDKRASGESWQAGLRRLLPFASAYVLMHGLLVAAGLLLSTSPQDAVSIWPAVGLLCAVLASTPRRTWLLWILCSLASRIAIEVLILDNRIVFAPIAFSLVNVAQAVLFALFMQKPLIQSYRQGRPLYLSVILMLLAIVVANVGGMLGAVSLQFLNFDVLSFGDSWRVWAAGDFVGIILITPVAIYLMLPQIRIPRKISRWPENLAMAATLFAVLAVATYLAPYTASDYAGAANISLAGLLSLPVLWAAFRAEYPVVAGLQIILAVAVIVSASNGMGPFAHTADTYLPTLAALQLFLIVTVLVVTVVSFAILESQKTQQASGLHQRFSDMIVLLTSRLIGTGAGTVDAVIEDSLQKVGEFAQADRCDLMQMCDGGKTICVTHSWAATGVVGQPPQLTRAALRNLPWVAEQFKKNGYIILRDVDKQQPETSNQLQPIFSAMPDTVAAIYVGLFADDNLIGAIGYGYAKPSMQWTNESISLMYLVGQLFANILQRKVIEKDLETYRDKLRSLAKDMAITEERARRRTAIDLHDGIGQNLAVARMKIGQLLANESRSEQDLTQLRNLIDDALRGTRFIISDLSPSILYELGLVPALQSLAERFEPANDLTCKVEETGAAWEPGNDMRIALYRAVQECLNNVARHAQAQSVIVRVAWFDDKLDIDVIDDGVGFDAAQGTEFSAKSAGFGLFSLRESIALLGGTISVDSARGLGTTIHLCVPRRHEENDE